MSVGYHPENLKLQPYSHDAVKELAAHAARLGVQFKINGIPFGASYDRDMWNDFFEHEGSCSDGKANQIRQVDGVASSNEDGNQSAVIGGGAPRTE